MRSTEQALPGLRPSAPARSVGLQWIADLSDCACKAEVLEQAATLEAICLAAVSHSGLVSVGCSFHQFRPSGATGVVLLAESHLAVHTWPELRFVAIDLYVCNFLADNTVKAQNLFDELLGILKPARPWHRHVQRRGATVAGEP